MNSVYVVAICLVTYLTAYFVYGRYLRDRIFELHPERDTPAHISDDEVDYVPANKWVLFGHHFASIAGLGPIVGPALGVIWGWVPAVLWVLFGTIFFGAVHDFAILYLSLRHEGKSLGDLAEDIMGKRAKILFLLITFFLLALAMGVFVLVMAKLFTPDYHPEAVVPIFSLIVIAVIAGFVVYKTDLGIVLPTVLGVVIMLGVVWVGMYFPLSLLTQGQWSYVLLLYAFIASVLPVWLLLQPRDYLNSFLLYIGLIMIYAGIFVSGSDIVAPSVNTISEGLPRIFPFLFITIACGAISGFHSLVSSGTTVRQIDSESDAQLIAYGGMVIEGILALAVIIASTAGVASLEKWQIHYKSWEAASGLGPKLNAFLEGGGSLMSGLEIPAQWGTAFLSVLIVSFAMTTLDTGARLLRFNIEELLETAGVKSGVLNRYFTSFLAVVAIGYFALMKIGDKPAGLSLWQLFGTTNQLLAALGLLAVSVYLIKIKKPSLYTLIPMICMFIITLWAVIIKIGDFYAQGHLPLLTVGLVIFGISLWLLVESVITLYPRLKS